MMHEFHEFKISHFDICAKSLSRGGATTATQNNYFLENGIQKFVERVRRRNSEKKNKLFESCDSRASFCFSGIS